MKPHLVRLQCQIDEASRYAWPPSKLLHSKKTTQNLPLDSLGDEGFLSSEGEIGLLDFRPSTKKIEFMLPEWWKGPTASERVFIFWDVACAQNGIGTGSGHIPQNLYLRVKFLSIKPNLIYSGELENEMSPLSSIFHSFHLSILSQLF